MNMMMDFGSTTMLMRLTRLMRMVRAGGRFKAIAHVYGLIAKSMMAVWPVGLLFFLFCFIATLLGKQLFGPYFHRPDSLEDYLREHPDGGAAVGAVVGVYWLIHCHQYWLWQL